MFFKSFRARLSWFFVVIVLLPIVMVTVVLFRLVSDSERGKSDARLAQAQTAASNLYRETEARSAAAGRRIATAPALAQAIAGADRAGIRAALQAQLVPARAVGAVLVLDAGGRVAVGAPVAVAGAATTVRGAGELTVSAIRPAAFAAAVSELTDLEAVVTGPGFAPAATLPAAAGASLPDNGTREIGDRSYRVAGFASTSAAGDGRVTVRLLADRADTDARAGDSRVTVLGLLLAFVLLAFLFAAAVSRSLQAQIARLLQAARRLGGGDLDAEVPTEGDDEFAALGTEFNVMARQLKSRLDELESERERLRTAIRRVGESIATGSDRSAVLDIVLQTAVDGTGADAGRASVRQAPGGPLERRAATGDAGGLDAVLDAAEDEVLEHRAPAERELGGKHALAQPLRPADGSGKVVGLISIARGAGGPFSSADRDLFDYLAGRAAVSIENVDLQESVQRQAVTDGLTGLFNHRRFQEVVAREVERSRRFGQPLGLVMLDLDDFKAVNDRHGHLQGDEVLREVARVLLDTAREIDEPARYGGEELAVVLPQTDLDGALEFAERLRRRIEGLEVPVLQGDGAVRITASVGVAALPGSAVADKDALVQAADSALYRAKRLGKNRVIAAG